MFGYAKILATSALISGCASTVTHTTPWSDLNDTFNGDVKDLSFAYSGVCLNFQMIIGHDHSSSKGETLGIIAFYDMPFSFAVDTVLYPIDLSRDLYFLAKNGSYPDSLCTKIGRPNYDDDVTG